VRIRAEDVARIRAAGDPYHRGVADQVDLYPGFHPARRLDLPARPAAAAVLVRPDLVALTAVRPSSNSGRHTRATL